MCCCRATVRPIVPEIARAILATGRFIPMGDSAAAVYWQRSIPEENTIVKAEIHTDSLSVSISPAVSVYEHHHGKRITAGVYLEIAAKYAEKVGGEIIQHATVPGCVDDGKKDRLLAQYPDTPLQFSQVCKGFQEEFMNVDSS